MPEKKPKVKPQPRTKTKVTEPASCYVLVVTREVSRHELRGHGMVALRALKLRRGEKALLIKDEDGGEAGSTREVKL